MQPGDFYLRGVMEVASGFRFHADGTCNLVLEHVRDLSFIFKEASRVLVESGQFFISELHPFRQYQGTQANFFRNQQRTEIQAFVHHISDFTSAAAANAVPVIPHTVGYRLISA
jgi:ubiquinone/menaquinone biosynthesis C-methylase UbiE